MNAVHAQRLLIVNADDFGLSRGVNDGIVEAHERGIVTSTSLMVRWPAAKQAGAYVATHRTLSAGLHVDLGEWAYHAGEWIAYYEVVALSDDRAVEAEVERQIEAFTALTGLPPTHLDSHQHVHQREPVRSIIVAAARRRGIPVRHFTPAIRYCGDFYGQTGEGEALHDLISAASLAAIIDRLSAGYTELACHPGFASDLETMYRDERAAELAALCDPGIREHLRARQVALCGFRDVPVELRGPAPVSQP